MLDAAVVMAGGARAAATVLVVARVAARVAAVVEMGMAAVPHRPLDHVPYDARAAVEGGGGQVHCAAEYSRDSRVVRQPRMVRTMMIRMILMHRLNLHC